MNSGYFPSSWKEAMVTAIFKKNDRQDKTNYRPISLLSCMSKVFERIVFNFLYDYLVKNGLLNEHNSGFRKNDSTVNRLLALLDSIYKGLEEHKDIILILLDISKAFDKVWHPGLLYKLKQLGIKGTLYKWIESYLTNRVQRVVVGGQSSSYRATHAGVPQGSILGPLLFLIFINDMTVNLKLECHQYADDTTLVHKFIKANQASVTINTELDKLSLWATQWRITFNAIKTHYMLITNKKIRPFIPPIKLNNVVISEVKSHENLGLSIMNTLSWKDHITKIVTKAQKRLNVINRYKNYLPRLVLERLYTTMIRPVLEYGDLIYDNAPNHLLRLIDQTQRRAALICTGAYRHTETTTLLRELSWQPLQDRRRGHKLITFYKIYHKIYPNYLHKLIPPANVNNYNLRTKREFKLPTNRLQSCHSSYFPTTAKVWNDLPPPTKNVINITQFKRLTLTKIDRPPIFYTKCTGKEGRWLCRLRLGLSALKGHRFKYNLITDPYCEHCINKPETTEHYLIECPSYQLARTQLLNQLSDMGIDINDNEYIIQVVLHGTNDIAVVDTLLPIIFNYLKETQRFK